MEVALRKEAAEEAVEDDDEEDFLDVLCDLLDSPAAPPLQPTPSGTSTASPSKAAPAEPLTVQQGSRAQRRREGLAAPVVFPKLPTEGDGPAGSAGTSTPSVPRRGRAPEPAPARWQSAEPSAVVEVGGLQVTECTLPEPELAARLQGRQVIKLERLCNKGATPEQCDWVCFAVLVQKDATKQSKDSKSYACWSLSDLQAGSCKLVVRGEVHAQHWTTLVGQVVGILNPEVLPPSEKFREWTLSVKQPGQIMRVGKSVDFGLCQGIRRSDNQPCTIPVNTRLGHYCDFHVTAGIKKAKKRDAEALQSILSTQRMALQGSYAPIDGGAGKPSAPLAGRPTTKPASTLQLNQIKNEISEESIARLSNRSQFKNTILHAKAAASGGEGAAVRQSGAFGFYRRPNGEGATAGPGRAAETSTASVNAAKLLALTAGRRPQLGRGLTETKTITLGSDPVRSRDQELRQQHAAAAQILQAKRAKLEDEARRSSAARREAAAAASDRSGSRPSAMLLGRDSLSEEDVARIRSAKSQHAALHSEEEHEALVSVLEQGEAVDTMHERMRSVTERKLIGFKCTKCEHVQRSFPKLCAEKGHTVEKVYAKERFFECLHCQQHTSTFGEKIPSTSCRRCGHTSWKPASMMKEYKDAGKTEVLARGKEHGQFINSWMAELGRK